MLPFTHEYHLLFTCTIYSSLTCTIYCSTAPFIALSHSILPCTHLTTSCLLHFFSNYCLSISILCSFTCHSFNYLLFMLLSSTFLLVYLLCACVHLAIIEFHFQTHIYHRHILFIIVLSTNNIKTLSKKCQNDIYWLKKIFYFYILLSNKKSITTIFQVSKNKKNKTCLE